MELLDPAAIKLTGSLHDRIGLALRHLRTERPRILGGEGFGGAWGADQAGRWIGAVALAARYLGEPIPELAEVVRGLLTVQNASGFFGTRLNSSTWWGAGRALMGLLEYREATGNDAALADAALADAALAGATRLGDFYLAHMPLEGPGLTTHHSGHEEGLVALWRATGNRAHLDLARKLPATVDPEFGRPDEPAPNHHTHSYLSMLRGCVDIYLATGETAFLDRAQTTWEHVLARQMWVTGGISEGSAYPFETRDETCSVADWLRLSLKLWQATGEPRYMDVAEHVLLNHLAFDQDHNGGFCTFRSVAVDRTGYVRDAVAWFCCSMSGLRALIEATRFIYTASGAAISVNLFFPCEATVTMPGGAVRVVQTGAYPAGEPPRIRVIAPAGVVVELRVRVPGWAAAGRVSLNGRPIDAEPERGYISLRRAWAADDVVQLDLQPRLQAIPAGANGFEGKTEVAQNGALTLLPAAALRYGPLVLMLDPVLSIYDMFEPERFAITVASGADGALWLPPARGRIPGTRAFATPGASFLTLCRPLGPAFEDAAEALGFLVPVAEITDRWTYTRSRLAPYEIRNDVRVVRGDEAALFEFRAEQCYRDFLRMRAGDTAALPESNL